MSGLLACWPAGLLACFALNTSTVHGSINLGQVENLGDSITWGDGFAGAVGASARTPTPGGYRTEFYQHLLADGYAYQAVGTVSDNASPVLTAAGETANEGHPGFDSTNIARDLVGFNPNNPYDPGYWLTGTAGRPAVYPNYVVLNSGVNDLGEGIGAAFDATVVLPSLLDTIYGPRPNTDIVLSTLLPDENSASVNAAIGVYNAYLPSVVADYLAKGDKISLVDAHAAFVLPDGLPNPALYLDGEHPNQVGYNLLGDVYAKALESAVPEPAMTAGLALAGATLIGRRRRRPGATQSGPA